MTVQKFDTGKRQWRNMPLELLRPLNDTFNAGVQKVVDLLLKYLHLTT